MWSYMTGAQVEEPQEPEHEYSGFLGDLSPEMEQVFLQFKEWVAATGLGDLQQMLYDDHDLLRFCRARKFALADIQAMW